MADDDLALVAKPESMAPTVHGQRQFSKSLKFDFRMSNRNR